MKARALRIQAPTAVPAVLGGRACEVLDISVSGALTVVEVEVKVGDREPFQLGHGSQSIELVTRVVRVEQTDEYPDRWRVAVAFENVTPAMRRAISSIASRVMVSPRRSGAAR